MPERLRQLEHWLGQSCGLSDAKLAPASADASFRRYFRVTRADGSTLIAMDAPPGQEDCHPFVEVAARLERAGLHVPHIHAQDLAQGFLLLEDLGAEPYLDRLDETSADRLYGDAMRAIREMQAGVPVEGLPQYDRAMLLREMQLFPDWLLDRHLGLALSGGEQAMLQDTFELLVESALAQPVVCVHRDFHSRNLMVVERGNPGVIDFQDAVAGPVTYDLVSLLRDCYVGWPAHRVDGWLQQHYAADGLLSGSTDMPTLRRWFDRMGVQRHLKAAGIFARLNHRDGKPGYLPDIPRTLGYIMEVGRHDRQIRPLADLVGQSVLPRL